MTNKSNARVRLQKSEHSAPPSATITGPVAAEQVITVSIITRRRNPLALHELGGRILSHEEFSEKYAGDPADFEALRGFAHANGLAVDEAASSLARRTLVVRGSAAAMEKAFGVTLKTYRHTATGREFHSFEGSIEVTAEHAPIIEAVLGLDNRPIAKPHIRRRTITPRAAGTENSFSPPQVAQLYNYPTNVNGAGQTIGILELGGGYETSDITAFFNGLGITPPTVVAVSVDGATNVPGGDPSGADGEVALDIQVAGSIAPGAKIAVYFTPNTDQGFIDAITTAVHDTANKPSVLSISWGGPESSWAAASATALDNACQSAGALGVTVLVASGDNGSTDGGTGNNVDFPASSPHVLACGGTQLEGSESTITSEVVWDDLAAGGGATGGGVSTMFALPTWQANANVPKTASGSTGRGVPDVAGDAAPATGYNILIDGQAGTVGGTSAVAPLWSALIAMVNQQRAAAGLAAAGFVNPTLYGDTGVFHDIISGNNGTYQAGTGWDACTGLGSPDGVEVAAALSSETVATGIGTGTGVGAGSGSGSSPGEPEHHRKHQPKQELVKN
jgi:kumamolisin